MYILTLLGRAVDTLFNLEGEVKLRNLNVAVVTAKCFGQ